MRSYEKVWEARCYPDGIPDEVPDGLMKSMRVPSYKALAHCILQNDLMLYGVGFQPHVSHWYRVVKTEKAKSDSNQLSFL